MDNESFDRNEEDEKEMRKNVEIGQCPKSKLNKYEWKLEKIALVNYYLSKKRGEEQYNGKARQGDAVTDLLSLFVFQMIEYYSLVCFGDFSF